MQNKVEEDKKQFAKESSTLNKRYVEAKMENEVLAVKLKEKDQELKLHELKGRELKKTIPNTKLRPIDHTRYSTPKNFGLDNQGNLFKMKQFLNIESRIRNDDLFVEES